MSRRQRAWKNSGRMWQLEIYFQAKLTEEHYFLLKSKTRVSTFQQFIILLMSYDRALVLSKHQHQHHAAECAKYTMHVNSDEMMKPAFVIQMQTKQQNIYIEPSLIQCFKKADVLQISNILVKKTNVQKPKQGVFSVCLDHLCICVVLTLQ